MNGETQIDVLERPVDRLLFDDALRGEELKAFIKEQPEGITFALGRFVAEGRQEEIDYVSDLERLHQRLGNTRGVDFAISVDEECHVSVTVRTLQEA